MHFGGQIIVQSAYSNPIVQSSLIATFSQLHMPQCGDTYNTLYTDDMYGIVEKFNCLAKKVLTSRTEVSLHHLVEQGSD